jgi:hypothetical protein
VGRPSAAPSTSAGAILGLRQVVEQYGAPGGKGAVMAGEARIPWGDRVDVSGRPPTRAQCRAVAADPAVAHLQTSTPVSETTWRMIDEEVCAVRPDITVRIYGSSCDLSLVRSLPHVRRLEIDVLEATGLDELERLSELEHLGLAVFGAGDLGVLGRVTDRLTSLAVGATRSKRPDMAPLARFRGLRVLYVEGQSKGIDAIAALSNLEELTLRSVTTPDLRYLAPLPKLWSLDLKLGGIRSLEGVVGKTSIAYLELWQIRGLEDAVEGLCDLPGLRFLFLQSLPRVARFPDMIRSEHLRRIQLINLKRLRDFTTLEHLPGLREFSLVEGAGQQPEDLVPVLRNPRLERAEAWFGSDVRNRRFLDLLSQHGKEPWTEHEPFDFAGRAS